MPKGKVFEVGTRVFAKVRGYPAWPARVEAAIKGGKYNVFFYGTYESATCKADELWEFNDQTKARYGKQKRKGFLEGMYEIENNPLIQTAEKIQEMEEKGIPIDESMVPKEAFEAASAQLEAGVPAEEVIEKAEQQAPPPAEEAEAGSKTPRPETPKPGTPTPPAQTVSTPSAAAPAASNKRTGTKRKAAAAAAVSEEVDSLATPSAAVAAPPPAKQARSTRNASGNKTPSVKDEIPVAPLETKTPETPQSTPAAATAVAEKTSRSGRLIKPKKFDDEIVKEDEPATKVPQKGEPRKMWVTVKATGDMIEINLDKDRPISFESKDAEIAWERVTAKNALKYKEKVESGQFIPDEIRKKLEAKTDRTPQEDEILKRERQLSAKKEKIRWLKVEQRLVDIDLKIKDALHFERPSMAECLKALEELYALEVMPLMLKKQPDIVTTIRKLRKYVGPEKIEDQKIGAEWNEDAQKIRLKANQIFMKLQNAFSTPPANFQGVNFWDNFEARVMEFREATQALDKKAIYGLVSDPTAA